MSLLDSLHAADVADLLEQLPDTERSFLVETLGTSLEAETYTHLDDAVREDIIENVNNAALANVVVELEHDDAVDFTESLETTEQQEVLEAMPAQVRVLLENSLRFLEESAGRLMRRDVATTPSYWNVGQTVDFMRSNAELPSDFYLLMVVGPTLQPIGVVTLSHLLRTTHPVGIADIMKTEISLILA